MANGTVKWFNASKGFGFIAPRIAGERTSSSTPPRLERAGLTGLADDQKVTYEVELGRDGRDFATNIALA